MTSKFIKTAFFCIAAMLIAPAAQACQPCIKTLNADESIKKADLIILAESKPFNTDTTSYPVTDMPPLVTAKVLRVLKGNYPEKTIELRSWYGMCPYGFIFRQPQEVLFIKSTEEGVFERVESGCDQQSLPYKDGLVDGKETLDTFEKRIK